MVEQIFIVSMMVMAIWATMWPKAIFESAANWLSEKLPKKLHDPLFDCPICMVPYYGSAIYWLIWGNNWKEYIIVVIAAMGLNAVLVKLFPPED